MIYSERKTQSGITQAILTENGALHVRRTRGNRIVGGFRFRTGREIDLLERAISLAKTIALEKSGRTERVGRIGLPSCGIRIEVAASAGHIVMRLAFPNGDTRGRATICGEDLAALALAVSEFKKATAAPAAL